MKSKSGSRKSSPKKFTSRPNSALSEDEEKEKTEEVPPPGIDGQMLTTSDTNLLDVNLEITNPKDSKFIPDDASSIELQEHEEGEEKFPVLTEKIIAKALSNLNTSADGTQQGYSIQNISKIQAYPFLQKIDLPYNNISDLSVFSHLRFLIELDVSHNEIQTLLDFEPPYNLQEVNFSYNQINKMPDLSSFPQLSVLNLDHNSISEISGISQCLSLRQLSVSYNHIHDITGLNGLKLQQLKLSHNSISKIQGVESLKQLQFIDLSGNNITSLDGLQSHPLLNEIDLSNNSIENIAEIEHIKNLRLLRKLDLSINPIMNIEEYRLCILFQVSQLTELDKKRVDATEKVAAINMFDSPPELQATLDHITQTVYNFLQPKKIYECTLPNIEMPYPMLILTGPQASGKRDLAHRLMQEFPDFFGCGVSHTTRNPYPGEIDGKDYYFISKEDFHNMVRQGCFIQTYKCGTDFYGLSMDGIENVAKEGLACVVHMEIEGVRTLRNTHFEPRFVLIMPFDSGIHHNRMIERAKYSQQQIKTATIQRAKMYIEINQDHPGFFDMTINSDKLAEAYDRLRQLVMDYLGLTEPDPSAEANQTRLSTTIHRDEINTQHTTASGNMRRTWSRPSFAVDSSASNDASSTKRSKAIKTPVEEASIKRREDAAKKAIEGVSQSVYDSFFPRPMVPMTAPAVLEGSPYTQAISLYHDPSFVASSLYPAYGPISKHSIDDIHSDSTSEASNTSSGLSGLSSARGFSGPQGDVKKTSITENKNDNGLPDIINEPLDLSALTDALDSLKGSLSTPPPPRDTKVESLNVKPVLPPITTK